MVKQASRPRGSERDQRRRQLLDAADAVVRRLGASASMDAIAAEAGITKPILYRHFQDKGGLYQALAERYVGMLTQQIEKAFARVPSPAAGLAAAIETYVRFVERNVSAYRFLMNRPIVERPEAQTTVREFVRQLASELGIGLRDQLEQAGLDARGAQAWAHGVVGMVQLATDWWLEERPYPRSQLVDHLVQMLWGGFAGLGPPSTPAAKKGEEGE